MRHPQVRWCLTGKAWRSDTGPYGKNGRRTAIYFREIPNTEKGRRRAQKLLDEYLLKRDGEEAEAIEDRTNPSLWAGIIKPYLDWISQQVDAGKLSEETYRSNRERLMKFAKSKDSKGKPLADRLIGSLKTEDGEAWIGWLETDGHLHRDGSRTGLSATRVKGVLASVNCALNWAAEPLARRDPRVILERGNPFAKIKVDPATSRLVRIATPQEIARLLRAARADHEPWHAGGRTKDDWWKPGRKARCAACRVEKKAEPCRRSHNLRSLYGRVVTILCRLSAASGTRPKELRTATWASQVDGRPGWNPRHWQDENGHWWGLILVPGKTHRVTKKPRAIPVPPPLCRAIERLRRLELHPRLIFPRLTRGGNGEWTSGGLAAVIRKWRESSELPEDFSLYSLRHRWYTTAVSRGGLTADQAGAIGGTSGKVVEGTYLQEDLGPIFEGANKVRKAIRRKGAA